MRPHERQEPNDLEDRRPEDILSHIISKVKGSNKIIKEMKEDVSTLIQTATSHSISIKQLEMQMCQISLHLNPQQQVGFHSDTMANRKDEV